MTLTITTQKGRTAQTTRYQALPNAMRHWAVPFARGEGFTLTPGDDLCQTAESVHELG